MRSRTLVIDIGNTSVSLGVYQSGRVTHRMHVEAKPPDPRVRARLREMVDVDGVCLASVVPRLTAGWKAAVRKWTGRQVLVVGPDLELGVPISYPDPGSIGADRLANACGAVSRHGAPVIVVDFGTALTFDVILKRKGYVGGIIAPGLPLMTAYLPEKAALLPPFDIEPVRGPVGRSTVEAMQLGAVWGYQGIIREILSRLKRGIRARDVSVCVTGGYAQAILDRFREPMRIEHDLTLFGLGKIYELNAGR